jgi:hypothetical protein
VDELRRSLAIPEGDVRSGWPSSIDWRMGRSDTAAAALDGGQGDVWIDVPRGFLESLDRDGTVKVEAHLPRVRPVSRRSREQFTAVIRSLGDDARRWVFVAIVHHPRAGAARPALDALVQWSLQGGAVSR